MYSYDRTAAIQEKVFTDPTGRPTGPTTPWGKADGVREVARGVRWVNTPGHGGLGVSKGVADKVLSTAARRLGDYAGGVYWYEEDVQCSIPFYEHPEWAHALGMSGTKESEKERIEKHYPKYFEYLTDGVQAPPTLKPGMKIKFLVPAKFGSGWSFKEGDIVVVESVTPSTIIFAPESNPHARFRAPMGYYYGHGFNSAKHLEAVE
jgi:hypothetical protein